MKFKLIALLSCLIFLSTCGISPENIDEISPAIEEPSPTLAQPQTNELISIPIIEEIAEYKDNTKVEELIKTNINLVPSYSQSIESINIIKHPKNESVFLIRFSSHWFYDFYVAKISQNSTLDLKLIGNGHIAKFVKLHGFDDYFIELYYSSHQGNGGLFLYSLNNETSHYDVKWDINKVYDCNHEGMEYTNFERSFKGRVSFVFKNGYLEANYNTVDNNGYSKLIFTGVQQIKNGYEDNDILYEGKCKLVYKYAPDYDSFVLNIEECIFPKYWFYNWNAIDE